MPRLRLGIIGLGIADFLDAVESGSEPRITGEEALEVHFLIDALLEGGRSKRPATVRER